MDAIGCYFYLSFNIKFFIWRAVIQLDNQVPAPSIDDILHLPPVEVHWSNLIRIDNHYLFGVKFSLHPFPVFRWTISKGKQE